MWLAADAGAPSLALVRGPILYVGFDRSTADGNARWPVVSGSIAVVFSFRALNHLNGSHVVDDHRRGYGPLDAIPRSG